MDYQKLKDLIYLQGLQDKSDREIADILNAKTQIQIVSRFITARTILAEVPNGATVLDKMEAVSVQIPALKWAMKFLQQEGGIDIGHEATQMQIMQLVAGGVLTQDEGDDLRGLANATCSPTEAYGLGTIYFEDVAFALRSL